MRDSIILSPKHGVNPSLSQCFYCGGDKNEIVLPGRLKGDVEAPRKAVWNMEPCDQCKDWMSKGIILISTKDGTEGNQPYRTGCLSVMTEEAFKRIFTGAVVEQILKCRWAFVPDTVWDAVGLPRENFNGDTEAS